MTTKLTPMLRQYLDIKKEHQNEILFFRMGDFYEMFFEDAHTASNILDIALTKRQNDVPMCGIPFHASESYIARLIKAGYRVAICEQLETVPSEGTIVKREVVRIVTPGTVIESNLLQSDENNFLSSVVFSESTIYYANIDISTGDFFLSSSDRTIDAFRAEITKYNPKEILLQPLESEDYDHYINFINSKNISLNKINDWLYDTSYLEDSIKKTFTLTSLKSLELNTDGYILAAGSILEYLSNAHKSSFDHLKFPKKNSSNETMVLDEATINNLELIINQNSRTKSCTLFSVLNNCKTAMGKRILERNILQPLISEDKINNRLTIVSYFFEFHELVNDLSADLKEIQDLERIISRFTMGKSFPRDLLALKNSINASLKIKKTLSKQADDKIIEIANKITNLSAISNTIDIAILDEPALTPEQGRIIKENYNSDLDHLYNLKKDGRNWILNYQEEEKKNLDIPTLKIKYNKIHGYYIEVSKGQSSKVPTHYLRKQTLVNSERYTTEKLQEFETDILSSSDKIVELEKQLLKEINNTILNNRENIQSLASAIGYIDFYISLASSALENNFVRPEVSYNSLMHVEDARHPVVEKYFTEEVFIPNDINFDNSENIIKIITGPNMSGKSTYIRTSAIIQLMAQIGSFVPANSAVLPIVDRIFTRIGASDNISRGESTFLVEMNETATILNNATDKSLIIMDEVGRGTSTYDGLSLAWAIVEYILKFLKSKTMFATHYHELTSLSSKKGIVNYNVLVKESSEGVHFLHKVIKGAADKSYGIHVARLAGIPKPITDKAERILLKLEKNKKTIDTDNTIASEQMELFNAANHRVINAIKNIDLNSVSPIEALNELNRLKNLIE